MRLALYHPEHGYYPRLRGFGAAGDFVTSPEVHPLFGYLLARQALDVCEFLGSPKPFRILELGGGSGALACTMLSQLPEASYAIDELSPALREVQQHRLAGGNASWHPHEQPHLVIANEFLDAQPVHRLTVRNGVLRELCVDPDLQWIEAEAPPEAHAYFERLKLLPPEGAIAEVNLALGEWVCALAARVQHGLMMILDYGYPAEALFSRPQGTLLTYYRHTLGSDPLQRLGEQDISVHVDFTTLATSARDAGLQVIGVTSQSALLRNLGLLDLLPLLPSPVDRQAVHQLVDPNGLGRIGALFLGRGLDGYTPAGLTAGRSWPILEQVPTLPEADTDFVDQWQEAFATS